MSDTTRFNFRKDEHLRRAKDFDRVYARRRSTSDSWLIVYACENGLLHNRLGLSVAKKKFARATDRNRVRRLYREAFRLTRHQMPTGLDLVLIPRQGEIPRLETLRNILPRLVRAVAKKLDSPIADAPADEVPV